MSPSAPTRIAGLFEPTEPAPLVDFGLGESWCCRDPHRKGAVVAVKLLGEVPAPRRDALDALVTRMKGVRHPNVLRVASLGVADGGCHLVHDFFEGSSLGAGLDHARAEGAPLPKDVLLEAFLAVGAALDAAHRAPRPSNHLGLDPSCVILRRLPGKPLAVKVVDFGLAHLLGAPAGPRELACRAPELAGSGEGDPRSDVYSLGALLREMLNPAPARDARGEALTAWRADVPERVKGEVRRALDRNPSRRHPTVRALAEAVASAWDPATAAAVASAAPVPVAAPAAAAPMAVPLMGPLPVLASAPTPAPPTPAPPTPAPPTPTPRGPLAPPKNVAEETISLANVAARRPPSPWDLGALRQEHIEAEEAAVAGWFRQAPDNVDHTMVAQPGVRLAHPGGFPPARPPVALDDAPTISAANLRPPPPRDDAPTIARPTLQRSANERTLVAPAPRPPPQAPAPAATGSAAAPPKPSTRARWIALGLGALVVAVALAVALLR